MFGTEGTDNLFFSVSAGQLDEQLSAFMKEYPSTCLIIIDTLQKIRETGGDRYSYANDYEIITHLKQFADKQGICILLVHIAIKFDKANNKNEIDAMKNIIQEAILLCNHVDEISRAHIYYSIATNFGNLEDKDSDWNIESNTEK